MIDIRLTFLNSNIETLKSLVNSSKSIQPDISSIVTSSKGTYSDEFKSVAGELATIQNSLDTLLTNTVSVLENAKKSYVSSDKSGAALFEIANDITKEGK